MSVWKSVRFGLRVREKFGRVGGGGRGYVRNASGLCWLCSTQKQLRGRGSVGEMGGLPVFEVVLKHQLRHIGPIAHRLDDGRLWALSC